MDIYRFLEIKMNITDPAENLRKIQNYKEKFLIAKFFL